MLSNMTKVEIVGAAYIKVISEAGHWVKRKPIKYKTYEKCVSFYDTCEKLDYNLVHVIGKCLERVSEQRCKLLFKKPYPPLAYLIADGIVNDVLRDEQVETVKVKKLTGNTTEKLYLERRV